MKKREKDRFKKIKTLEDDIAKWETQLANPPTLEKDEDLSNKAVGLMFDAMSGLGLLGRSAKSAMNAAKLRGRRKC